MVVQTQMFVLHRSSLVDYVNSTVLISIVNIKVKVKVRLPLRSRLSDEFLPPLKIDSELMMAKSFA